MYRNDRLENRAKSYSYTYTPKSEHADAAKRHERAVDGEADRTHMTDVDETLVAHAGSAIVEKLRHANR